MKNVNECSLKERGEYNEAQQDAIDTHSRGIAKLKVRNAADGIEEDEIQDNLAKIADLKVDRGILKARREAFFASQSAINPPTDPQLKQIKTDLDSVNALTVDRRIVSEVASLTTDAFNTFSEIQPS
jgi:hypothetical protein